MQNKLFWLVLLMPMALLSQISIIGKVKDVDTNKPLPFATVTTGNNEYALTSSTGEFIVRCNALPTEITISYLGYHTKTLTISTKDIVKIEVTLSPQKEDLETVKLDIPGSIAANIIKEAIRRKDNNNPKKALKSFKYKSYNKFKITEDNQATFDNPDTTKVDIEHLFNDAHSFLSEKVSTHQFKQNRGEHEIVKATRMSGFEKPIYSVLGIKVQSNSLYEEDYTVFNNKYAGPLSNRAIKNYYYKVLDTIQGERPAFVILFQPRRARKIAGLEGILYLDMETLAIQKAIAELRGELNVMVKHDFNFFEEEKIWFPTHQEITIKPGIGKQKVSLFGGKITVGRLSNDQKSYTGNNDFLISKTDLFDIVLNTKEPLPLKLATIEIDPKATTRDESYWSSYRTTAITERDLRSFPVVDSIVQAQNIERRINIIQNFNAGYFPVSFFDFDLTYPIKFNNFEGFRIGIGGITNEKFSERFRLEGYLVYGFLDKTFKYGLGVGALLNKKTSSWLNLNYYDDLKEVGSFLYLTDRRVYSLFEPRLVNIDFYYKHRTWSTSLQHRISPKLLSETQISLSNIAQTGGYTYINDGNEFSSYKILESSAAIQWSPFSEFLRTPEGYKEIKDGYPKITAQYTQGFKGLLNSNFNYSKFGIKTEYIVNRLNLSKTSLLLEADISSGNIPLTHLFHAYPNAPTKETIFQRFSVAGRRSFETMFFSEFFSDRLATLQIAHQLRPFKITRKFKPELILISKYAIGDVSNRDNHQGVDFNSLEHVYQESGFELNKLFAGFGLSFAYRYGAYHLPNFADNLSFKFTFYLKL